MMLKALNFVEIENLPASRREFRGCPPYSNTVNRPLETGMGFANFPLEGRRICRDGLIKRY
jgi:hypothetical protein